jgi:peptidoglycan/xylan/chitin deacetylase (PgdA/CDA1 family)
MTWRSLFSLASPAGARTRLSVLIFHRVLPQPDPLFDEIPDAARFEQQMRWVANWFNVLPLSEAVERLARGALPARSLSITFDDGYADNAAVAAPILQRLGLRATFFVTSGVLDGGRMWNDSVIEAVRSCRRQELDLGAAGLGRHDLRDASARRRAIDALLPAIKHLPQAERSRRVDAIVEAAGATLPDDLMMSSSQVRSLTGMGMEVGGHTVSHPILARLDDEAAWREIGGGRDALRQITGEPIGLFAYPNGVPHADYDARHVRMVQRCGFSAACSTAPGVATPHADRFQLPRFTPWDRGRGRFALRMARNLVRTKTERA